jgi:hypothetical protein
MREILRSFPIRGEQATEESLPLMQQQARLRASTGHRRLAALGGRNPAARRLVVTTRP